MVHSAVTTQPFAVDAPITPQRGGVNARTIKRVVDEPAYVLHGHDWSESSLIVDVISRHHGRLSLVAKGAKKPTSQLRAVLLPLQPVLLSWAGNGEVKTLRSAQWQGGHIMPRGEALLAGTYVNELLMRLLPRDDAHSAVFDAYAQVVAALAGAEVRVSGWLRAFELRLLQLSGYLPDLTCEGSSLMPLQNEWPYVLTPELGLSMAPQGRVGLMAVDWWSLHAALQVLSLSGDWSALVQQTERCSFALQPQLRMMLHYHCGVRAFKTRQMLLDVQSLCGWSSAP